MAKTKSFFVRHVFGWWLASMTIIMSWASTVLYTVLSDPIKVKASETKIDDMIAEYFIANPIAYGDLIYTIIIILSCVMLILFLLPTITDLIDILFKYDEGKDNE